jgi:four helix bundle protein
MMQITELEVWKAAMELSKICFTTSAKFGDNETTGLGYQLRRTVINIPANISAAASRKHGKESLRHLFRARDLIYELESHMFLANKLDFINEEVLNQLIEALDTSKRLLFGFIKYYKRAGQFENTGRPPRRGNPQYDHSHDDHDEFSDIEEDDDF